MMQWDDFSDLDLAALQRRHPAWQVAGSPQAGFTATHPADPERVLRSSDGLMLCAMIRQADRRAGRVPPGRVARWLGRVFPGRSGGVEQPLQPADLLAEVPAGVAGGVARQ